MIITGSAHNFIRYLHGIIWPIVTVIALSQVSVQAQITLKNAEYQFENAGFFSMPTAMSYDAIRHRLAVADKGRNLIYIFDLSDKSSEVLGAKGELKNPTSLAFDSQGNLFVSQANVNAIIMFGFGIDTPDTLQLAKADSEGVSQPGRIYIDGNDNYYFIDNDSRIIYVADKSCKILGKLAENLKYPQGILVRPSGEILIADKGKDPICVFSSDFKFERRLSPNEPLTDKMPYSAAGLASDQKGWIYSLNLTKTAIEIYDPAGINRKEWIPSFQPFFPVDMTIDKYNTLYVLDSGVGKIWVFEID